MTTNNIIEIQHLKKHFKEVKAVDDISFSVKKGELFAFLGLNGAGKSTTINILCGQLDKDSGKIYACGYDLDKEIDKIKPTLGVVFQNSVLDNKLTVLENLKIKAKLYDINNEKFKDNLEFLSDKLEFKDILNRPLYKLSGGQKKKNRPCTSPYSQSANLDIRRANNRAWSKDKNFGMGAFIIIEKDKRTYDYFDHSLYGRSKWSGHDCDYW